MTKPTFYALVIIEGGEEQFGGAYANPSLAENKGRQTGKKFEVRPAYIE